MRKNKAMRLASGLLVAVMLTTCIISGTFAKYVTTNKAEDTIIWFPPGKKIKDYVKSEAKYSFELQHLT